MRRFQLHRDEDISGVSGTGHVADGVQNDDGTVVVTWLGAWPTVTVHARGMASVEHIHGHGGATRVVWVDDATGTPVTVPGGQYREPKIRLPEGPGEGMKVSPQTPRHIPFSDPLEAMRALGRPQAGVITCQVYSDGHECWSEEPTDAERIDVQNVRKNQPDFRGVLTLNRGPKGGRAVDWRAP